MAVENVIRVGRTSPEPMRVLAWVCIAAAVGDRTRERLQGVEIGSPGSGGLCDVTASDGRRLHRAAIDAEALRAWGLEPGRSHRIIRRKATEIAFSGTTSDPPDYRRVIPDYTWKAVVPAFGDKAIWALSAIMIAITEAGQSVPMVNASLIDDVVSWGFRIDEVRLEPGTAHRPLLLKMNSDPFRRFAVVMPGSRD